VKFFFPINLLRILRAATNVGKRYFRKTLWKYVHTCGRKFPQKQMEPSTAHAPAMFLYFLLDIRIN